MSMQLMGSGHGSSLMDCHMFWFVEGGERSQPVCFWVWSGDSFFLPCETWDTLLEGWFQLHWRACSAEVVNPRLSLNLRPMMGWTCPTWHESWRQTWKHRLAVEPSSWTCSKWKGALGGCPTGPKTSSVSKEKCLRRSVRPLNIWLFDAIWCYLDIAWGSFF